MLSKTETVKLYNVVQKELDSVPRQKGMWQRINIIFARYNIEFYAECGIMYFAFYCCILAEVEHMTYSYNRLWKLLIDRHMTKTEMRKASGISTNVLAKMGKGEPIAMGTLAKIATTFDCGFDDIMEVIEDKDLVISDAMQYGISDATLRNWGKLYTKSTQRLTSRANKRKSQKRVFPLEYISNKKNISFVQDTLNYIDENGLDIMASIFSLGISLLKSAGIYDRKNVTTVLSEYADITIIDDLAKAVLPVDEFDILGLIYQSFLQEGKKNIIGSYYTPQKVAHNMTKNFDFSNGEVFFDPCCGSGAFLLSVAVNHPNQMFGVDNDKVAVLIAKINLLLKYKDLNFIPQVYCFDFLVGDSGIQQQHPIWTRKFNYIATNPPWGAMDDNYNSIQEISSKESFSFFFVRAHQYLRDGGIIRFLFPEAILRVKVHKDIRKFILNTARLVSITIYRDMFSGVATKYIDIECCSDANKGRFTVYVGEREKTINIKTIQETENLIINLLSDDDMSIVRNVKSRGCHSLRDSIWALGVVTGDNKNKLSSECLAQMEKIYTGKEIQPYVLKPAKNYILYDRSALQQVAKEEIYRASEKLVYKFISNKLVFAYDNTASLFLNSANILIPKVPSMSIKTVMAFLNSPLFQFMYIKLFGEAKILKGNLTELPFPEISETENEELTMLVDAVLSGDNSKQDTIDNYIFSIYNLTEDQRAYVRRMVNGKVD